MPDANHRGAPCANSKNLRRGKSFAVKPPLICSRERYFPGESKWITTRWSFSCTTRTRGKPDIDMLWS